SASDNGAEGPTGVVTWTVGTIGAGASVTRTVTVKVNSTIPAGVNSITNSASAFADAATGPDPTPDNNTDTDTDTLNAAPDLVVTKTDGVTTARPGDLLNYTLVITNVGNQDATNVFVADILPPNTTFVSASQNGTFANGIISGNIGTLAAGASFTITGTLRVDDTIPAGVTSIINEVQVHDDGANGLDPTPANNVAF